MERKGEAEEKVEVEVGEVYVVLITVSVLVIILSPQMQHPNLFQVDQLLLIP